MKVFIGHSFSDKLDDSYYDLVKEVYDIIYNNNQEILTGGLLPYMTENYQKYAKRLTCYSIPEYQSEQKLAPSCHYELVEHMLLRTKRLVELADIVVFLPGGSGTIEEIFACLESYKSMESPKKIYLLNVAGHFDMLLAYLKELEKKEFNKEKDLHYIECISLEQLNEIMKEGI